MKISLLTVIAGLFISSALADPVKVACVGDSITFGAGVKNRGVNCYLHPLKPRRTGAPIKTLE